MEIALIWILFFIVLDVFNEYFLNIDSLSRLIYTKNMSKGIIKTIRQRIMDSKDGSFFFNSDFWDIGNPETVRQSLLRLTKEKLIRKIGRGMYEKPEMNEHFKLPMPPDSVDMAFSIAKHKGWTITREGNYGVNKLGIDTQVPAGYVFVSDGPSRIYKVHNRTLTFIHRIPKDITDLSTITAFVIEALKFWRKGHITDKDIIGIRYALNDKFRNTIKEESGKASDWIQNTIKQVCKEISV